MSPNTTQLSIVTSQGTIDRATVSNVSAKKGGNLLKLVDACILDSSFDLTAPNLDAKIFLTIQPLVLWCSEKFKTKKITLCN